MTAHNGIETNNVSHLIQSLAALLEQENLLLQKKKDIAGQLSAALDRLQNNPAVAAGMTPKIPAAKKQRHRRASSALSPKEQQVWACVHVQGKTVTQASIEFSCTVQNISKHLSNAQRKLKAQQSRSVNTRHRLPEDTRGQAIAC